MKDLRFVISLSTSQGERVIEGGSRRKTHPQKSPAAVYVNDLVGICLGPNSRVNGGRRRERLEIRDFPQGERDIERLTSKKGPRGRVNGGNTCERLSGNLPRP